MRTALAVIGIVIGVSAVVLMVAIGRGAQESVLKKIQGLGTNLIIVTAGKVRIIAGRPRQTGNTTSLTVRDAEALAAESATDSKCGPVSGQESISSSTARQAPTRSFQAPPLIFPIFGISGPPWDAFLPRMK